LSLLKVTIIMALFEIVSQASGRQDITIQEWIQQQLIRFMMVPDHAEEAARRITNMKDEDQIEQTITVSGLHPF
jgi:hypothetical protein